MKRIETLTEKERRAIIHTLNDAALDGVASYSCCRDVSCDICPIAYDCTGLYVGELPPNTFSGWLAWLCGDVKGERNSSGYRVFLTECINHYHIVRPDGVNIYAVGQPLPLLPRDYERNSALAITDIFASRYGAACILVEDTYTEEMSLYSDIL